MYDEYRSSNVPKRLIIIYYLIQSSHQRRSGDLRMEAVVDPESRRDISRRKKIAKLSSVAQRVEEETVKR